METTFKPARTVTMFLALAALLCAAGQAAQGGAPLPDIEYPFENVGLGGGGGMYTPAVSPHDPRLMFMTCDMSGVYRSADGGETWKILPFREIKSARVMKVTFDPNDPQVMYTYGGPEYAQSLHVSRDMGLTWRPLLARQPWGSEPVVAMAIDKGDSRFMIVGTTKAAYVSDNAGTSWRGCSGVGGRFENFYIVPGGVAGAKQVFAASDAGLWRSDDSGVTWAPKAAGIVGEKLTGFCGGTDAESGETVLFCTLESGVVDGEFAAGIFRSADLGESWQSVMTPESGLNIRLGKVDQYGAGDVAQYYDVDMASNQTDIIYCPARGTGYWPPRHNTIYKSADSGKTWRFSFSSDARFEELNVTLGWLKYDLQWGNDAATWFDVSDTDSDVALRTENGATHLTTDGGRTWRAVYTRLAEGAERGKESRWVSTGMEVTTTWHYFWDPADPETQYICYTDIGFARSEDDGHSWRHSPDGSPWANTFYDMVFDPDRPGVIYAACSNVHDIPHATYTDAGASRPPGGVCVSTDHGRTWKSISNGLPDHPYTSICLDPASRPESRTLWVTNYGMGVFKTTDGGATWRKSSRGLGRPGNQRALLVRRAESGNLYCSIGPLREGSQFPVPGGLYKSRDGGDSWVCINSQLALGWQTGFAIDPTDEDTIYCVAASGWQNRQGGLYRTTDGGKYWKRVFTNETPGLAPSSVQAMFVTLHPDDPKTLYLGTDGHGLWLSRDGGDSWKLFEGIPFGSVHRVHFDPRDHSRIAVTTFGGGVWKGPALGAPWEITKP